MGIIDIFIASEAAVYGLTQQRSQAVLDVPPRPGIVKNGGYTIEQSQRLVQVTIGEKSVIRRDFSTMKLKPYTTVKTGPQTFTLWVICFFPRLNLL